MSNEMGDDGGPAFPLSPLDKQDHADGFDGVTKWSMGMSRRDYFAAAALAGGLEQGIENDMASALGPHVDSWWHSPEKIARRAFDIAEAMLKESSK